MATLTEGGGEQRAVGGDGHVSGSLTFNYLTRVEIDRIQQKLLLKDK